MKKSRLDLIVIERGLFATRQAAQTAIMDGAVLVNGEKITKPGQNIAIDARVELKPGFATPRFVSRGGLKLEKALTEFAIAVEGRRCLDLGASTGGFTDCLLQYGASRVYAVDVGYGQLDWSIRTNERVVVLERINVRHLKADALYGAERERANLLVADLSFISLAKILPAAAGLLEPGSSEMICLIKPQFEVGRESIAKGGVVKSQEAHVQAISSVLTTARQLDLRERQLTFSPITGPAGNIEYLVLFANWGDAAELSKQKIAELVACAHNSLKKKENAAVVSS